jgi:hypothetical protein
MYGKQCSTPRGMHGITGSKINMNCWKITSAADRWQHQRTGIIRDIKEVV